MPHELGLTCLNMLILLLFPVVTTEKKSPAEHDVVKRGLWVCPICTYDNDESLSFCEFCGVIRNPSVNVSSNGGAKAAKAGI